MRRILTNLVRFRLRTLLLVVSAFCLYLAAYLALREPVVSFEQTTRYDPKGDLIIRVWPVNDPQYRWGGEFSGAVFGPMAWLDWQLRRDYWVQRHWDRVVSERERPPYRR